LSEQKPVVAVDIGATKTVVAVFVDGEMREIARFPTADDPARAVEEIADCIAGPALDAAPETDGAPVGIGSPGPLNPFDGVILAPPNMPRWIDVPLREQLEKKLRRTVRVENDANVGALGEAIYGSGEGFTSIFYVTISTGIGSGLVIDGRIHGGHRGIAGEVEAVEPAHFYGRPDGLTLNEISAGPGLVRSAKRRLAEGGQSVLSKYNGDFNTHELFAAVDEGDQIAIEILEAGRNGIAGLLTTALFTIAPDAIVLAGGLCTDSRWYVDPVRDKVKAWMKIPELAEVPIERAKLWDRAVLYGAAQLVI